MSATAEIMGAIANLRKETQIDLAKLDDKIKTATAPKRTGAVPWSKNHGGNAPAVRHGDSSLSSDGFSFGKMFGALSMGKHMPEGYAKNELNFCQRLTSKSQSGGYSTQGGLLVPLWPEAFSEAHLEDGMYHEMKDFMGAGVAGANWDEMRYLSRRSDFAQGKAAVSPAQSWEDATLGGGFVPPPTFGPPIELLRNKEIMMRAGATVIPLGPSGRIVMPRLNVATTAAFSGENTQNSPTTAGTGTLELMAKKIITTVVLPGEFLRFSNPSGEALIRADIFKTVALQADYAYLSGAGGGTTVYGLQVMGANSELATVTPTAANQLAPQDAYTFLANVELNNGEPTAWIMRPNMTYAWSQARWSSYSGGANTGGFMFEFLRELGKPLQKYLCGIPVIDSPQVIGNMGTGAQTYILCGWAEDYLIGMFGAIEFTQTDGGWTLLSSDQVAVRAILTTDGAPRHKGVWAYAGNLNASVHD